MTGHFELGAACRPVELGVKPRLIATTSVGAIDVAKMAESWTAEGYSAVSGRPGGQATQTAPTQPGGVIR